MRKQGGAWVAQWVERQTLGFSSGLYLVGHGIESCACFVQRVWGFSPSVPSLPPSPTHALTLALAKINKSNKKKKTRKGPEERQPSKPKKAQE